MHTQFTEIDFKALDLFCCDDSSARDFFKTINGQTLGRKVSEAIHLKEKGHFDKAMLAISEANRDQVLAIREIQTILDKADGAAKTEVIFEKYRQIFPFQIGLVNGETVLNLLSQIDALFHGRLSQIRIELHGDEDQLSSVKEELAFFEERMKGKISQAELGESRENISNLAEKILSAKKKIVDSLIDWVTEKEISSSPDDNLRLIKNFYLIITSSIDTLDARFVGV